MAGAKITRLKSAPKYAVLSDQAHLVVLQWVACLSRAKRKIFTSKIDEKPSKTGEIKSDVGETASHLGKISRLVGKIPRHLRKNLSDFREKKSERCSISSNFRCAAFYFARPECPGFLPNSFQPLPNSLFSLPQLGRIPSGVQIVVVVLWKGSAFAEAWPLLPVWGRSGGAFLRKPSPFRRGFRKRGDWPGGLCRCGRGLP